MDEAALVGAVLYQAPELDIAAKVLAESLESPSAGDSRILRRAGIEPALVDALRAALPSDADHIRRVCENGAAWIRGRRSIEAADHWELVATLPPHTQLPRGLHRATAETLVGLVIGASRSLRISAPYVDTTGIGILTNALVGATARGVSVDVFEPRDWKAAPEAIATLQRAVAHAGDPNRLRIVQTTPDAPWAHLKVVVADARLAYIGSAKMTGAGLGGRNLELGVLVHGADVVVIDRLLDLYRGE